MVTNFTGTQGLKGVHHKFERAQLHLSYPIRHIKCALSMYKWRNSGYDTWSGSASHVGQEPFGVQRDLHAAIIIAIYVHDNINTRTKEVVSYTVKVCCYCSFGSVNHVILTLQEPCCITSCGLFLAHRHPLSLYTASFVGECTCWFFTDSKTPLVQE